MGRFTWETEGKALCVWEGGRKLRRQEAGRHVSGLEGANSSADIRVSWAIKRNSTQRPASSQVVSSDSDVGSGL